MSFSSGSANIGNILENWIFDIEYAGYSSGTLRVALKDYSDGTNFYYGVILNNPSIRDSIDLKKSTAKTSNLTITIADFEYKGNKISEFIFGSVNYFINRNTTVKSVINDDSAVTIGNFRLIDFSTDGDNVNLVFSSHRPWDFISFPQTQTSTTNQYVPIVYGTDFTGIPMSTFIGGKKLFPLPKIKSDGDKVYFASPRAYSGDGASPYYYDKNIDEFIVMAQDADSHTTSTFEGDNAYAVSNRLARGTYLIRPTAIASSTLWDNDSPGVGQGVASNAIDGNPNTNTNVAMSVSVNNSDFVDYEEKTLMIEMPKIKGQFYVVNFRLRGSVQITNKTANHTAINATSLVTDAKLADTTFATNNGNLPYHEGTAYIRREIDSSTGTFNTSGAGEDSAYTELELYNTYASLTDTTLNLSEDMDAKQPFIITNSNSPRLSSNSIIKIDNELMRVVSGLGTSTFYVVERQYSYSSASTHSSGADIFSVGENGFSMPSTINIRATVFIQRSTSKLDNSQPFGDGILTAVFTIKDFYLEVAVENATQREPQATQEAIENLQSIYSANNALKSGITGLSGNNITYIHQAHLDLLNRFTGLDVATNPATNIEGWGNGSDDNKLDHAKNWKIRYWQTEPVELKKELERLQYEGGFIFKYKKGDTSIPQYIFIKDSYSSTDYTLTKHDISSVNIKTDSYSDLLTKMSIEYERHPAQNRYLVTQDSINSSPRTNYSIHAKENVANVKLNAYVSPTIPSSPSSEPNDDFYTYYNNIFGDIKLNISGIIVNPKFYDMDVGDTVDFNNMYPEKAFGKSFTNVVFMITSLTRSMESLKFKAREIGAIT